MEGFEPPNAGTRTQCLTTWRHPNMYCNHRFDASLQGLVPAAETYDDFLVRSTCDSQCLTTWRHTNERYISSTNCITTDEFSQEPIVCVVTATIPNLPMPLKQQVLRQIRHSTIRQAPLPLYLKIQTLLVPVPSYSSPSQRTDRLASPRASAPMPTLCTW